VDSNRWLLGPEPGCPSALRIFPTELGTGTADSAFRVDNLCCLFFNRRPLESWRMIFRINLAMLRVESGILRPRNFGLSASFEQSGKCRRVLPTYSECQLVKLDVTVRAF